MLLGTEGVGMLVYMWRRHERVFVVTICGLVMLFAFVYLL